MGSALLLPIQFRHPVFMHRVANSNIKITNDPGYSGRTIRRLNRLCRRWNHSARVILPTRRRSEGRPRPLMAGNGGVGPRRQWREARRGASGSRLAVRPPPNCCLDQMTEEHEMALEAQQSGINSSVCGCREDYAKILRGYLMSSLCEL
jgi:hypothetical protein